jgi:hypothetical protein
MCYQLTSESIDIQTTFLCVSLSAVTIVDGIFLKNTDMHIIIIFCPYSLLDLTIDKIEQTKKEKLIDQWQTEFMLYQDDLRTRLEHISCWWWVRMSYSVNVWFLDNCTRYHIRSKDLSQESIEWVACPKKSTMLKRHASTYDFCSRTLTSNEISCNIIVD